MRQKARQEKKKATIVFPAKLIVDGEVVCDEFPDWYSVLHHGGVVGTGGAGPDGVRPGASGAAARGATSGGDGRDEEADAW